MLWIIDIRHHQLSQLTRNQELLTRVTAIQNQPEWYEREKEAASQRVKYQSQLWLASSKGLAQAELQAFLRTAIDANKLTNSRITLETVENNKFTDDALSIWRVSAQVRASFKADELQKVLWAISTSPRLITIRTLDFTINPNNNTFSNFTLFVDAWFDGSTERAGNE